MNLEIIKKVSMMLEIDMASDTENMYNTLALEKRYFPWNTENKYGS